ncbi:MAG: UDP-glucose 4-epimerase [Micromonosporaceae bacterium]|nr:UDP-glucose 4-epimerase [Micromonosporaceae bacterium]MDT5036272.1 UDP-glucose 4-epimerase [Micromonosporaceae bacterium]
MIDRSEAVAVAPTVVLVTGVARLLGAQVASRLSVDPRVERVIGVDFVAPTGTPARLLDGVEVRRIDLRSPEVARLLGNEGVQAVAHLAITTAVDYQSSGRGATKELNVIGTMQLLAACQQAPDLRRLVIRSSTAAYGASFRDPAVFTEDTEPRQAPRGGYGRDVLDVEGYVRGFRRRCPQVSATVLRFAPFIGERAGTRLNRYFALPIVPTVLGRDPRLQFIHVDDALEVLHRAVVEEHPGTYNVAGAGVLTLSQAIRRAGRIAFPVVEPGLSAVAGFAKSSGALDFSLDQLDLFVHGRVVDTSRLVAEFGFEPRSTAAAFDDFIRGAGYGPVPPDSVRHAETVILERIRRARAAMEGYS